jgi:hypothetical protein
MTIQWSVLFRIVLKGVAMIRYAEHRTRTDSKVVKRSIRNIEQISRSTSRTYPSSSVMSRTICIIVAATVSGFTVDNPASPKSTCIWREEAIESVFFSNPDELS